MLNSSTDLIGDGSSQHIMMDMCIELLVLDNIIVLSSNGSNVVIIQILRGVDIIISIVTLDSVQASTSALTSIFRGEQAWVHSI